MQEVHVPQARFQHGNSGTCLMALGNQVVMKLRTNNMDWQMQILMDQNKLSEMHQTSVFLMKGINSSL
jgi:hypothetical protein